MSANGNLADSELTTVDGWARLTPPAAAAYLASAAYILRTFAIRPVITPVDGAYRSLAQQISVKAQFGVGAATPGFSNHGLGTAFDMYNITSVTNTVGGQAALDAIMARFGFTRDAWNGRGGLESWHYHLIAVAVPIPMLAGHSYLITARIDATQSMSTGTSTVPIRTNGATGTAIAVNLFNATLAAGSAIVASGSVLYRATTSGTETCFVVVGTSAGVVTVGVNGVSIVIQDLSV
jgi:hypothetical protein